MDKYNEWGRNAGRQLVNKKKKGSRNDKTLETKYAELLARWRDVG
jgi:hypothetical protein